MSSTFVPGGLYEVELSVREAVLVLWSAPAFDRDGGQCAVIAYVAVGPARGTGILRSRLKLGDHCRRLR